MARVYPIDGQPESICPKDRYKFEVEEARGIIGGPVEILDIGHGAVMLINYLGYEKGLPVNSEASRIAGEEILGTVIVCNEREI